MKMILFEDSIDLRKTLVLGINELSNKVFKYIDPRGICLELPDFHIPFVLDIDYFGECMSRSKKLEDEFMTEIGPKIVNGHYGTEYCFVLKAANLGLFRYANAIFYLDSKKVRKIIPEKWAEVIRGQAGYCEYRSRWDMPGEHTVGPEFEERPLFGNSKETEEAVKIINSKREGDTKEKNYKEDWKTILKWFDLIGPTECIGNEVIEKLRKDIDSVPLDSSELAMIIFEYYSNTKRKITAETFDNLRKKSIAELVSTISKNYKSIRKKLIDEGVGLTMDKTIYAFWAVSAAVK